MYAVTSKPFVSRTRATLRRAEFGFFGVVVYTRVQTPRFCGFRCRAGALFFFDCALRPFRTSFGTQHVRDVMLVEAIDSDGVQGWGECVTLGWPGVRVGSLSVHSRSTEYS